jgi:hypothetical protein
VKHVRETQIVYERALAERQLAAFESRCARAYTAAVILPRRSVAPEYPRRELDRVDYLYIAGAAAVVHAEYAIYLIVRRVGGLVEKVFGADDDSGRAEPALEPARRKKAVGEGFALSLAEAFEGQYGLSGNVLCGHRARDDRAIIYYYGAAAALSLRAAPVFGGDKPEPVAQQVEQRQLAVNFDVACCAVERELDPSSHIAAFYHRKRAADERG